METITKEEWDQYVWPLALAYATSKGVELEAAAGDAMAAYLSQRKVVDGAAWLTFPKGKRPFVVPLTGSDTPVRIGGGG